MTVFLRKKKDDSYKIFFVFIFDTKMGLPLQYGSEKLLGWNFQSGRNTEN